MENRHHPPRQVALVSLIFNNAYFSEADSFFTKLSATQKIDFLEGPIKQIIAYFKMTYPNHEVIILWQEYGISDIGYTPLNQEQTFYLKSKMQKLVDDYPLLTIIAGSVVVKRHHDQLDYIEKLKNSYQINQWANRFFKKESKHYLAAFQINDNNPHYSNFMRNGIDVTRNMCFVFRANKRPWKHGKISPAKAARPDIPDDLPDDKDDMPVIFRPGYGKSLSHVCTIHHHAGKYRPLKVGIQICLEHFVNSLKENGDLEHHLDLDAQFIISNPTTLELNNIKAPVFLQADPWRPPQLGLREGEREDIQFLHFKTYLYEDICDVLGPYQTVLFEDYDKDHVTEPINKDKHTLFKHYLSVKNPSEILALLFDEEILEKRPLTLREAEALLASVVYIKDQEKKLQLCEIICKNVASVIANPMKYAQQKTLLHKLAFYGFPKGMIMIIMRYCQELINDQSNPEQNTPLHCAVKGLSSRLATELLLMYGANPFLENKDGKSVMDLVTMDSKYQHLNNLFDQYKDSQANCKL